MDIFKKKPKYTTVKVKKKEIPAGLWQKCNGCSFPIFTKTLISNDKICPRCDYHFPLGVYERVNHLLDKDTFEEFDKNMRSKDPLEFTGVVTYKDKIEEAKSSTLLMEAAIYGKGKINQKPISFAATDSRFIMGSMGSVVGEKVTRAAELALKEKIPLIIVSGSGGGARMYEGIFSLMQMAKTSTTLFKLKKENIPFISILTHPTMAGIMASFAGIGDLIIAEPHALIGFTGPRVIEQTIRQKLPKGFQSSEFNLEHGLIDMVINRKELKDTLSKILDYLT